MVNIVVAICTAIVLWQGTSLIVAGTMTAGALTVYLAYLSKFFKPIKDLASMTSAVAQTTVALERIQTILSADDIIQERADGQSSTALHQSSPYNEPGSPSTNPSPELPIRRVDALLEPAAISKCDRIVLRRKGHSTSSIALATFRRISQARMGLS